MLIWPFIQQETKEVQRLKCYNFYASTGDKTKTWGKREITISVNGVTVEQNAWHGASPPSAGAPARESSTSMDIGIEQVYTTALD